MLDVGSYPGTAYQVFGAKNHYTAFGLFQTDYIDSLARARIPYIEANIENYSVPNDSDIILFCEIIEHLRKPYAALKNLWALAKPGALIYVTTNNASYYGYILKLIFHKEIHHSITLEDTTYPGHTRYFGLDELAREFNCIGFEVLSKRYINFLPSVRYYRSRSFAVIKNTIGAILPDRYATNIELVIRKP